jgi:hypothetical protein
MADISKCNNKDCKLKNKCWRFLAPSGIYQSYADFKPDGKGNCDYFWEYKKDNND